MTKKLYLSIFFITIAYFLTAQKIVLKDGNYYYKKKLYTGIYTDKNPDGIILQTISIVNGKQSGKTTLYFENGNIKEERFFKNGLRDSVWTTFSEENIKIAVASFKDNLKDGKWYIWDKSGILRYDMEYKNGEKCCSWKMWNEKGELIQEKEY